MNEKISAFLDGELSARELELLWKEMGKDPALRTAWERYHMIGAALRKDMGVLMKTDLAARVVHRIEHEPLPFARASRRLPMRHITKLSAGLAIAASVAAVAVFSFQSILLPDPAPVTVSAPGSSTQLAKAAQDSSLNALLVKHNEFSPAASINGMMPYVRVVSHNGDQ